MTNIEFDGINTYSNGELPGTRPVVKMPLAKLDSMGSIPGWA